MQSTPNRALTLLGLVLTLGIANLPLGRVHLPGLGPLAAREVLWWLAVIVVLLYVGFIERLPLSSIGFRAFGFRSCLAAVLAGVVMVVGITIIYTVVFRLLHLQMNTSQLNKLLATPFWYRVAMVTRAAVAEETLFRGYAIERLEKLTGRTLVAAGISWAAFTIAHLSGWGWAQLIVAGFGGIVLTVLYLWRRNLWVNIIAHWITDGAGFLLPH